MPNKPEDSVWEKARAMARASADRKTDEEDAAITAGALADPDNPPLTERDWSRFRPLAEVRPDLLARLTGMKTQSSAPPMAEVVTLRLSGDVLDHFRKQGEGWQQRIDEVLRKAVADSRR